LKDGVPSALRWRQHGEQRTEETQVSSHGQRIERLGMTLLAKQPLHDRVSCIRTAECFRPVSLAVTADVNKRKATSGAAPSNYRVGAAARRERSTNTGVKTH
jgi:hypothetical protein